MFEIKKGKNKNIIISDESSIFIIQDYVYDLYTYLKNASSNIKYEIIGSKDMEYYIVDSWMDELTNEIKNATKTSRCKKLIENLKIISTGINFGIREYQIKNKIHTMLTDRKYDEEFSNDKKPFNTYLSDNDCINYELSSDLYQSLSDCINFFIAFNTSNYYDFKKNIEELLVFDNDYYITCIKNIFDLNKPTSFFIKFREFLEVVK